MGVLFYNYLTIEKQNPQMKVTQQQLALINQRADQQAKMCELPYFHCQCNAILTKTHLRRHFSSISHQKGLLSMASINHSHRVCSCSALIIENKMNYHLNCNPHRQRILRFRQNLQFFSKNTKINLPLRIKEIYCSQLRLIKTFQLPDNDSSRQSRKMDKQNIFQQKDHIGQPLNLFARLIGDSQSKNPFKPQKKQARQNIFTNRQFQVFKIQKFQPAKVNILSSKIEQHAELVPSDSLETKNQQKIPPTSNELKQPAEEQKYEPLELPIGYLGKDQSDSQDQVQLCDSNAKPTQQSVEQSEQIHAYKRWINSLGIQDVHVNYLLNDLKDGRILLRIIDHIRQGTVDWSKYSNKLHSRIHIVQNCNYAAQICKDKLELKIIGIGGMDIVDAKMNLTLGIVWQLHRLHLEERQSKEKLRLNSQLGKKLQ